MKIRLLALLVIGCIYVNASPIQFHDGTSFDPMEGGLHPHITEVDIHSASNLDRPQSLLVQLNEEYLKGSVSAHKNFEADANLRIVQRLPETTFIVHASPRNLQAVSGNVNFVGQVMPQLKLSKPLKVFQEKNQCIYAPHGIVVEVVRESHGSSRSLETLTSGWKENLEGLEMRYDSIDDVESSAIMSTVSVYVTASKDDARFSRCSEAWSNAANFLSQEQEVIYLTAVAQPGALNMYARLAAMQPDKRKPIDIDMGKSSTIRNPFYRKGIKGAGVTVFVVDTAIDMDHAMFYDPDMTDVPIEVPSDHRKFAFVREGPEYDDKEHGTHVAATIAGSVSLRAGEKSLVANIGIAPLAKLAWESMWTFGEDDSVGLVRNVTGARIQSNSWGYVFDAPGPCNQLQLEDNAYDSAYLDYQFDHSMYYKDHMLQVFAAGNEGSYGPSIYGSVLSPGSAKNVLTVGATNSDSQDSDSAQSLYEDERNSDTLTDYSSVGPTFDGRIKPDVVAIGNVVSAESSPNRTYGENINLVEFQGTSMATPVISGLAALVQDYFQQGFYPGGERFSGRAFTPSSILMKAMLINGATPIKKKSRGPERVGVVAAIPQNFQFEGATNIGQKYMGFGSGSYMLGAFDRKAQKLNLLIWSDEYFEVEIYADEAPALIGSGYSYGNCDVQYYEYLQEFYYGYDLENFLQIEIVADGKFFIQTAESYERSSSGPKMNLECEDTFASLGMLPTLSYHILCPLDCENEPVYGTAAYHSNSSVCASARHTGAIADGSRSAEVTPATWWTVIPYFYGNFSNGVMSMDMESDMDWGYEVRPDRYSYDNFTSTITKGPNMHAGFGRVDLPSVLPFKNNRGMKQKLIVHSFGDQFESIPDSGNHTYCFFSRFSKAEIKTTLTWYDMPTDYLSGYSQIILNLDLEIQKIGRFNKRGQFKPYSYGKVHYPNGRESADMVNNVEQISLLARKGDVFCARVIASSFYGAAADVKYALVTSGPVSEYDD